MRFYPGRASRDLPDCDATVLDPPGGAAVDPRRAAERALDDPHGPALSDLADPSDEVVIVTDATRPTPDDLLVELLLDRLPVPRGRASVVLGRGPRGPADEAEVTARLGRHADLAENRAPASAVAVGDVDGVPVELHPTVAEADLVLSTGAVQPHPCAGFSGGAEPVAVGAGGAPLIRRVRGPAMVARNGVGLGRLAGNPCRDAIDRAGDLAGAAFCLNLTRGPDASDDRGGAALGASAGRPRAVVRDLARTAREALATPVEGAFDAVVAGVPAPMDADLYRACRAATDLILGGRTPLRPGGRVVLSARLPEGAGGGRAARRFRERLRDAATPDAPVGAGRDGDGVGPGRAALLARALRERDVVVAGSERPDVVEECLLTAAPTVEDAIRPGERVLVVPDAFDALLVDPD